MDPLGLRNSEEFFTKPDRVIYYIDKLLEKDYNMS